MSDTKFKIGDRVKCKSNSGICCDDVFIREGQILKIESDETCYRTYDVSFTSNITARVHYNDLELVSRPSDDPKTAFLTELKALLEKYNAKIDCSDYDTDGEWWYEKWLKIFIGNEEICWYDDGDYDKENLGRKPKESHFPITPSNVFDYDKGEQPLP